MSLERPDALATLQLARSVVLVVWLQLPHSDGPVQTARNKLSAGWRKGNRVDAVLVARVSSTFLKSLQEVATLQIPDADTLVKTAGCEEAIVW